MSNQLNNSQSNLDTSQTPTGRSSYTGMFQGMLTGAGVAMLNTPLTNFGIRRSLNQHATFQNSSPFRGASINSIVSSSKYMTLLAAQAPLEAMLSTQLGADYKNLAQVGSYTGASMLSTVLNSPLVTIRTRMAGQEKSFGSVIQELKPFKPRVLFSGSPALLTQDIICSMIFPMSEHIKKKAESYIPSDYTSSLTSQFILNTSAFTASGILKLPLMMPFSVLGNRQKVEPAPLLDVLKRTSVKELFAPVPAAIPRMAVSAAAIGLIDSGINFFSSKLKSKEKSEETKTYSNSAPSIGSALK